jgi:transcription antitermination factor NusG
MKTKTENKSNLKVGDKVEFHSGNFEGLTGEIIHTERNSKHENAIYGIRHTVKLSTGEIGYIEKAEHCHFI